MDVANESQKSDETCDIKQNAGDAGETLNTSQETEDKSRDSDMIKSVRFSEDPQSNLVSSEESANQDDKSLRVDSSSEEANVIVEKGSGEKSGLLSKIGSFFGKTSTDDSKQSKIQEGSPNNTVESKEPEKEQTKSQSVLTDSESEKSSKAPNTDEEEGLKNSSKHSEIIDKSEEAHVIEDKTEGVLNNIETPEKVPIIVEKPEEVLANQEKTEEVLKNIETPEKVPINVEKPEEVPIIVEKPEELLANQEKTEEVLKNEEPENKGNYHEAPVELEQPDKAFETRENSKEAIKIEQSSSEDQKVEEVCKNEMGAENEQEKQEDALQIKKADADLSEENDEATEKNSNDFEDKSGKKYANEDTSAEETAEERLKEIDSESYNPESSRDDEEDVKTWKEPLEDSEYETPEPEDDEKELSEDDIDDDDGASESGASTGESQVLTEREDGDGEESDKKDKKLDHDEDKRDPQYIPKKGNFYEHDDRTSETEEAAPPKKGLLPARPSEKESRWSHDLYDESLQSPKSRQELIDQYGYDIRDEEGPPKARRRRRYGRGPNKYTRHWEEEEAYAKTRGSWRGGRGRGSRQNLTPRKSMEEFPPLPSKDNDPHESKISEDLSEKSDAMKDSVKPSQPEVRKVEIVQEDCSTDRNHPKSKHIEVEGKPRIEAKTPPPAKKSFKQVYEEESQHHPPSGASIRGRGRGRGRIPPGSAQPLRGPPQHRPPKSHPPHNQQSSNKHSTAEEDIATLSQHFAEAVINVDNKSFALSQQKNNATVSSSNTTPTSTTQKQQQQPQHQNQPQTNVNQPSHQPPGKHPSTTGQSQKQHRHEDSNRQQHEKESKSKRYSTQRQRSLPQGSVPPQPPPQPAQQQRYLQDQYYQHGPPPPLEAPQAPPPTAVPPPQFAPQQAPPPPQAYPPPPVAPPEVPMMAFIPPGGQFPAMYCPPPPAYLPPGPLPVQVNPIPQAPPPRPEVYQGAGGITYYNTQNQVSRPPTTSRRVKLAIPIVAPPDSS